jgi:hypothetical protein
VGPDLAAQRHFAGYLEGSKFLVFLHLGRLCCGNQSAVVREEDTRISFTEKRVTAITYCKSNYAADD